MYLRADTSVRVTSANPAVPYTSATRQEPTPDGLTLLTIPFSQSDGPARLDIVTMTSPCTQQVAVVAPVTPILPKVQVKDDTIDTKTIDNEFIRGIFFRVRTPENCFEAARVPVSLTIGGRRLVTSTASDPCLWFNGATLRSGEGWDLENTKDVLGEVVDDPSLTPTWSPGSEHRLRYSFALDGKPVASGLLKIRMAESEPLFTRIYAGTDAFQNYCINKRKTIYKSKGRRYCLRPSGSAPSDDYSVTIVRDKKAKKLR